MLVDDIFFVILSCYLNEPIKMCDRNECINKLNEYLPYIQKEYGVTGLCLFGSVARGDNRPDSDVDILVDMPPKIIMISALRNFLENALNSSIDLIRRHSHMSQHFLGQISKDGITLL